VNDEIDLLYQSIIAQLTPADDRESATRQILAVGQHLQMDRQIIDGVLERLISERYADPPPVPELPRLFVDWGELPQIGSTARPQFTLVCSGFDSRPEVQVTVDRDLDHDPGDPQRRPRCDEHGLWSFYVPFRLTTLGIDCRPGQYLLDVRVSFPEAQAGMPRFFGTRVRLMVKSTSGDDSVLEISGDGQSVVNLQGCDLRSFSKVVLKAGQDGIINLQELLPPSAPSPSSNPVTPQHETVTFEYQLKIDHEREQRLPRLTSRWTERSYLERAGLYFEDGRRVLLLAKRRVTLGRNRDNDIVLRFLPRSAQDDEFSRNISRTHAALELMDTGLSLIDESSTGLELNSSLVKGSRELSRTFLGELFQVDLGCTITVNKSFSLELELFGADPHAEAEDPLMWDQIYLKFLGERMPRLWQTALESGINAVRLDRRENLADQERYVLLFREILLGGSRSSCGIALPNRSGQAVARLLHAGRCFWIERLGERGTLSINDQDLLPRELVPLAVGARLNLDGVRCEFGVYQQMYLEEPGNRP
jgi:hypothetical protein